MDLRSLSGITDPRMNRMSQDQDMRQIPGPGPLPNVLPPPVAER